MPDSLSRLSDWQARVTDLARDARVFTRSQRGNATHDMADTTPCRIVFTALRREDTDCEHCCPFCAQLSEAEFTNADGTSVDVANSMGSAVVDYPAWNIADGVRATKWLSVNGPPWVLHLTLAIPLGAPLDGLSYTFLTANDEPEHDPISWRFECRRPDGMFAVVDVQRGVVPPAARMSAYPTFYVGEYLSDQAPRDPLRISTSSAKPSPPLLSLGADNVVPPPSPSPPPPRAVQAVRDVENAAVHTLSQIEHSVEARGAQRATVAMLVGGLSIAALLTFALVYCALRRVFAGEMHRLRRELAHARANTKRIAALAHLRGAVPGRSSRASVEQAPLVLDELEHAPVRVAF